MASIFTKIIAREIPAHVIYEDDICIAILDIFPSVKGQSLVIPKEETDYIFTLDASLYEHIFAVARKIARASDKALGTERTCLVVEGFEVPHVHIKLYPMEKGATDLKNALIPGTEATVEELDTVATQIQAAIEEED